MQTIPKPPGELCLDFANTLRWHASDQPLETLSSYADLVAWARKSEALTAREASQLLKEAQSREAESKRVFKRGIELREALYRIIIANIEGASPASDDLQLLNQEVDMAHRYWQITPTESGYQLLWTKDNSHLDRPLWHVTRSAVDLLLSADVLSRVGQCADDRGCGWLFIDWSKNHSRRWCDISDCGNRAKQRRHYARARKQRA
jgi:predicted RNA-binding Zn ribbon-like protein